MALSDFHQQHLLQAGYGLITHKVSYIKTFVKDGVALPRTNFSALKGTNFLCLNYHTRIKGIAHERAGQAVSVAVVRAIQVSYCICLVSRRDVDTVITRDGAQSP